MSVTVKTKNEKCTNVIYEICDYYNKCVEFLSSLCFNNHAHVSYIMSIFKEQPNFSQQQPYYHTHLGETSKSICDQHPAYSCHVFIQSLNSSYIITSISTITIGMELGILFNITSALQLLLVSYYPLNLLNGITDHKGWVSTVMTIL